MHVCLQQYQVLALQYTQQLETLRVAALICTRQTHDFSLKIRQIFVISMQLCCHEKAKICAFNEELMRETSSKFQQWNNAVNVKEFDVQDKKQEQVGCVRRKSIVSPTLPATVEREEREEESADLDKENATTNTDTDTDTDLSAGAGAGDDVQLAPSTPLLPLGLCSRQVLQQGALRFTTLHSARCIARDDLDGIAPTVVADATGAGVNFAVKGSWRGGGSTASAPAHPSTSTHSSTHGSSSSPALPNSPEKPVKKSRFGGFFSKHKATKEKESHPADLSEAEPGAGAESGGGEGGQSGSHGHGWDLRKSLESLGDALDESLHEEQTQTHAHAQAEGASLFEAQAAVTSEGVLHLYGLQGQRPRQREGQGQGGEEGGFFDYKTAPPLKSLLLEVT
jgi:hypothetical protein